jgi:hypothetical protein
MRRHGPHGGMAFREANEATMQFSTQRGMEAFFAPGSACRAKIPMSVSPIPLKCRVGVP